MSIVAKAPAHTSTTSQRPPSPATDVIDFDKRDRSGMRGIALFEQSPRLAKRFGRGLCRGEPHETARLIAQCKLTMCLRLRITVSYNAAAERQMGR